MFLNLQKNDKIILPNTLDINGKLEMQKDLKGASQHLLSIHEILIEFGNKYIAHADNSLYDQSLVKLVLDDNKKAIAIHIFRMSLENFESNKIKTINQII